MSKDELFRITSNPINWESKPGRMYSIYATTNLLESYNFVTNLTEGPYTQGLPNNTNNIFYKLEVVEFKLKSHLAIFPSSIGIILKNISVNIASFRKVYF